LMGSLAHTQVGFPQIIQIADLGGEYCVTFLILFVAACLTTMLTPRKSVVRQLLPLVPGGVALALTLYYAELRSTHVATRTESSPATRIALIQGNTLADWKGDLDRQQAIMDEYFSLSLDAVRQSQLRDGRAVDVIIWPETSFRQPLWTVADGYQLPAEHFHESRFLAAKSELQEFVRQTGAAILTGIDRAEVSPNASGQPEVLGHNSSVAVNKQGELVGFYDKMHLVLMGEYVPFSDWVPLLKRLTPITGLAEPGERPVAMELASLVFCPNICYETVVPHQIREHVTALTEANHAPDVLVNLTNDSWFWGSSELEMHLACGIFRAVEMRLPLLIAANGGLSAHVDPLGNLLQVTPRQQTALLLVDLPNRQPPILTCYARYGDWFAGSCVICCVVLGVVGWQASRSDGAN
ncbi:MAG: apolipoprotein N-acyltransferase, partial [Bythopirellula sp.]